MRIPFRTRCIGRARAVFNISQVRLVALRNTTPSVALTNATNAQGSFDMLKSMLLSFALLTAATITAAAQDRLIIQDRPAVVTPPRPGVVIERRDPPVVEKRTIETTGRGNCDSKTVRKEDAEGSTTVKKERCN
jgi:hypothetical protein